MPIFKIQHVTRYDYNQPVRESINELRIYPYNCAEQQTLQHEVLITGNPEVLLFNDYWGNKTGLFNVLPQHQELTIDSRLTIRTKLPEQLAISFTEGWDALANSIKNNLQLVELSLPDKIDAEEEIKAIAELALQNGSTPAAAIQFCNVYIFKNFKYIKGVTTIETTVDEILAYKSGVCQDFAHLLLQILRTLNIPARYVSGYICPNKNGMRGEGATHAWVDAWLPGYGWAGIDPTNNIWVTNNHVKLAVGRNFNDCSPIKGAFKGLAKQRLSVHVSVGYEDGNVFEERNNVRMEAQPAGKPVVFVDDSHIAVQQQQQQQ